MKLLVTASLIAGALLVSPAIANPVKIDTPIVQLDGKPYKDENGKDTAITVRSIIEQALIANYPDDEKLGGPSTITNAKLKRYQLLRKIQGKTEIDLSAEEIVLLRDLIGRGFNTYIVGRVIEVIDPGSLK